MSDRLERIEDKIDSLQKDMQVIVLMTNERVTKLEVQQKGVLSLCVVIVTAALGTLAKALHLTQELLC